MKKKQKINIFGFTLVELMIVVVILTILASISFISFKSYTKNSRDSARLATIKNIDTGVNLYATSNSKFPTPDEIYGTGVVNGIALTYVGYIGEINSRLLKFSNIPTDPSLGNEYTYGVSYDNRYYQISTVLENLETSFLINKTYASNYKTKVIGNYGGVLSYNNNGKILTNIPSLLFSSTGSVDLASSEPYFIVNNGENLPNTLKDKMQVKNNTKQEILTKLGNTNTNIYVENISNVTKENWEDYKNALKTKFGLKEDVIGKAIFGEKEYNSSIKKEELSYPSCILGDGTSTGSTLGECSL